MAYQADPLDALGKTYNALQGARQDGAMNRAGRAYAQGDYRGASNALAQGGMVGDAMALDQAQVRQQRQATEDDYAMAEKRSQYLGQGTQYLLSLPYEQRKPALAALEPTMRPLVGDQVWSQISTYDLSDENLRAFGSAIEQEAGRLFQRRDGSIVEVQANGQAREVVPAMAEAFDPLDGAPQGFMWTDEARSSVRPIPGYVEGRAQVSAANRAPPRARSSGGGSSRSRSSVPAAPARPAGRPWERFAR